MGCQNGGLHTDSGATIGTPGSSCQLCRQSPLDILAHQSLQQPDAGRTSVSYAGIATLLSPTSLCGHLSVSWVATRRIP